MQEGEVHSVKQVTKDAEILMNCLIPSSLRGKSRRVKSVLKVGESGLRSLGDTNDLPLAYVVNFADNNGYVILSAKQGISSVWAISKFGNLDISKEDIESPQRMILDQMELAYNISCYETRKYNSHYPTPVNDSTFAESTPKINLDIEYEYGEWEIVPNSRYECLIPVVWGQSGDPYVKMTKPYNDSNHAGCVTAAVAQIMAYYRYPPRYDWNIMLKHKPIGNPKKSDSSAFYEIGRFYRDLGKDLKVQYGKESSLAYDSDVPNAFSNFGYEYSGILTSYSYNTIKSQIKGMGWGGKPLYIGGCAIRMEKIKRFLWWRWKKYVYDGCHAFVLDGVCQMKRLVKKVNKKTNKEINSYYEYLDLVHTNLGWNNEEYNGYYNNAVFDTNKLPILKEMSDKQYGNEGCYVYEFILIKDIRP